MKHPSPAALFVSLALTGCYRTTPPIWLSDLPAATQYAAHITDYPRSLVGTDGKRFEVDGTLQSVEIEESSELPRATFLAPVKAEAGDLAVKIDSPSGSRVFPTKRTTVARLTYSGRSDRASLRSGGAALIVLGVTASLAGGVLILAGLGGHNNGGSSLMRDAGASMIPAGAILGGVGAALFAIGGQRPAAP